MSINASMKVKEIQQMPQFRAVGKYIVHTPRALRPVVSFMKLEGFGAAGWNVDSLVYGLQRLEQTMSEDDNFHRVYTKKECKKDKSKEDVNVVFFPKTEDHGKKPTIIICAGGGYMAVCSAAEGYPVAARFNEMGYNAFVVTYRVFGGKVMLKALEDLAASVRFILDRKEQFGLEDDYVLCGFSAGANLISVFGTENHGYASFGLPRPKAMFPVYTFIDNSNLGDNAVMKLCRWNMYGRKPSRKLMDEYNVRDHLGDYPPCYLTCGKDDSTVPPANSELLKRLLDEKGIPCALEEGEKAEHGFGEGRGTSVEGWYRRADEFLSNL